MSLNFLQQIEYKVLTMADTEPIYETLGDFLKAMRGDESRRSFALKLKIPHTTVADIEGGMKASEAICKQIAKYFHKKQTYIFMLNGTIDDDTNTSGDPIIEGTILVMKDLKKQTQEDVRQYALHRKRLENRGDEGNPQDAGADQSIGRLVVRNKTLAKRIPNDSSIALYVFGITSGYYVEHHTETNTTNRGFVGRLGYALCARLGFVVAKSPTQKIPLHKQKI